MHRLFGALAALFALPLSTQAQPSARMDQALLRPHLVSVAPHRRLNINCVGRGSPTVVFDQGGEGMVFNWARVQPAISRATRTCFYDRGGFGWSDAPDYPVTALSITDDLHRLLKAAGVNGPLVLVGHSIGGFYATVYADRFQNEVAGLVLVDPGFSGQQSGLKGQSWDRDQANIRRGEGQLLHCSELAKQGQLTEANLQQNSCYPMPNDAVTDAERKYALHAITNPRFYAAE
ncbi:MAG: alpha/beta fold hydrolase, partial [Oxalobacteraceae bacterium]